MQLFDKKNGKLTGIALAIILTVLLLIRFVWKFIGY